MIPLGAMLKLISYSYQRIRDKNKYKYKYFHAFFISSRTTFMNGVEITECTTNIQKRMQIPIMPEEDSFSHILDGSFVVNTLMS